jgi:hypothetical protein
LLNIEKEKDYLSQKIKRLIVENGSSEQVTKTLEERMELEENIVKTQKDAQR